MFCIICVQGNRDERETVDVSLAKQDAQVGERLDLLKQIPVSVFCAAASYGTCV